MKFTQIQFGKDLLEKVLHKEDPKSIGKWAFDGYFDHLTEIDGENFIEVLLRLGMMEHDPKYELSNEVLYKLSEKLIMGHKIDLTAPEYQPRK